MYILKECSEDLIKETKNNWIEQTKSLCDRDIAVMVADDVINIFKFDQNQIENEHIYFLVEKTEAEKEYGRAILKVMQAMPHSQNNSYLKLLNIHLEPSLSFDNVTEKTTQKIKELYEILAFSILESVKLIFYKNVSKLKIYGRTQEVRSIFLALIADEKFNKSFAQDGLATCSIEGAWLVIQKSGTGGSDEN